MKTAANSMDPQDFSITILPLLKDLTTMFREKDVQPEIFISLFQTCLTQYLVRFVGKEPSPRGLARDPVRCDCARCHGLNAFLRSNEQQVGKFSSPEHTRDHMGHELWKHPDIKQDTDKSKRPYILVVTKTNESYDNAIRDRNKRVTEARSHIKDREGRDSLLKNLLGDRYQNIKALSVANLERVAENDLDQRVLTGLSNDDAAVRHIPPQLAGQKRKAVVVDLTEETADGIDEAM